MVSDGHGIDEGPTDDGFENANGQTVDERFQELFGVSKEELIRRGVNPDVYMRENLKSALRDPERRTALLSESTNLRLRFFGYAKRAYSCAFAALGLLALTAVPALASWRTPLIVLSCFAAVGLVVFATRQISCAKSYRVACREEGIQPHLYGKR